ncbi:EamA family transporter [Alicyclobacillus acidiphilus]|uniref:EamA family transporter n=1 Tax=Alicyclobacillus acidiphilus TaxID=182455 RepID=UPI001FE028CE|nr:EamA family transporter [Alicyclobacillus acidiphilus]
MLYVIMILSNVCLLVAGQTLWKYGLQHRDLTNVKSIIFAMFTPWVIAGLVLYVIATVIWIYLLNKMSLSLLYPLQSLAYIGAILVSLFVFHEHIPPLRWVGVGVILVGVSLVAAR